MKEAIPSDPKIKAAFYYDETNNVRKYSVTERGLDRETADSYFVLAGLTVPDGVVPDVAALLRNLDLQETVHEIKFHNLCRSPELGPTLAAPRIQTYLAWLRESGVLTHWSVMNLLYYSVVDIVDSLSSDEADERAVVALNAELKDALFRAVRKRLRGFSRIIRRYSYPNIPDGEDGDFCREVAELLPQGSRDPEDDFLFETLRQLLKNAGGESGLVFLKGNPEFELISSFADNYLQTVALFPGARHVFDRETQVEPLFEDEKGLWGIDGADYHFADSKTGPLIQLSDVFAGLVYRVFSFVEKNGEETIARFRSGLGPKEREALDNFDAVTDASNGFAPCSFVFVGPVSFQKKLWALLKK